MLNSGNNSTVNFFSLVLGITSINDPSALGRVGMKSVAFKAIFIDDKRYLWHKNLLYLLFITTNSVPEKPISNLMQYLEKRMDQFKLSY